MQKILSTLSLKPETRATILPIREIEKDSLPENKDITEAYQKICETVRLGGQYEWLAKVALLYPGIEMGIEKPNGEFGGCSETIAKFGKLVHVDGTYRLEESSSSRECNILFGNISFPIIETTELEMRENIERWGYEDVMSNIWFCYNPIEGKPCGLCRPCQQKMECGMRWLLPKEAHRRYFVHRVRERLYRVPVLGFMLRAIRYVYRRVRRIFSGR